MAKATAVPKKNMTSQARAAISQKYASIAGPMHINLLYRTPTLSKGLPTASHIYHQEENSLLFTPLKFCTLITSSTSCSIHRVKATYPRSFGGKLSSQSQHHDRDPTRKEYTCWKRKIQTRLVLLSRPELAVGEAYEKSA